MRLPSIDLFDWLLLALLFLLVARFALYGVKRVRARRNISKWFALGDGLFYQDKEPLAAGFYQRITQVDPQNARAWRQLGLCCLANLGGKRYALKALRTAWKLDPSDEQTRGALQKLQRKLAANPHIVDQGQRKFNELTKDIISNVDAAFDPFDEQTENPLQELSRRLAANPDILIDEGQMEPDELTKAMKAGAVVWSGSQLASTVPGQSAGNSDVVASPAERIKDLMDSAMDAGNHGQWQEAYQRLDEAVQLADRHAIVAVEPGIHKLRAVLLARQGKLEEALAASQLGIQAASNSSDQIQQADSFMMTGIIHLNLGTFRQARGYFAQARNSLSNIDAQNLGAQTILQNLSLNEAICCRKEEMMEEAHKLLASCQNAEYGIKDPAFASHWFEENGHVLSWLFGKSVTAALDKSVNMQELAQKAKCSYLTAVNLFNPTAGYARAQRGELFRGALELAYNSNDALFGLDISQLYRFGREAGAEPGSNTISNALRRMEDRLQRDRAGLLAFHVDRKKVYVLLLTPAGHNVFASDVAVEELEEIVVNRWYEPCQSLRNNPCSNTKATLVKAISDVQDILAEMLSRARRRDGRTLPEVILTSQLHHLYIQPHSYLSVFPLEALMLRLDSGETAFLLDCFETSVCRNASFVALDSGEQQSLFSNILLIHDLEKTLPASKLEYAVLTRGPWRCKDVSANNLTRDELSEKIREYDAVHIACHAGVRNSDDVYPSIRLADGYLTQGDISRLDLGNMRLASAATCDSALAYVDGLDAHWGLIDAFRDAGCPHVNGCLWPVDDLATGLLYARYYSALEQGSSPSHAMRDAKIWIRDSTWADLVCCLGNYGLLSETEGLSSQNMEARKGELASLGLPVTANLDPNSKPYSHPFYWAAFVSTAP